MHGQALPGHVSELGRRADAVVQFTVPSFEYPRSDAPASLHFVGPLSRHRLTGSATGLVG